MTHAIIKGEYVTFKHIKTRKMVVLEIEVPEENFQEVITKLGMPIGGESKHVAIALIDADDYDESNEVVKESLTTEQSEGDKLRIRAVMLCKEREFQICCESLDKSRIVFNENHARDFICEYCNIKSRSELAHNPYAQMKFRTLEHKFKDWLYENQYTDNLSRC